MKKIFWENSPQKGDLSSKIVLTLSMLVFLLVFVSLYKVIYLLLRPKDNNFIWIGFLNPLVAFFSGFAPPIPENPSDKLPIKLFLTTSCHTFPDFASVCEITFKGSKETGKWRKIKKDDLVSFLHSFFVIAPRIITIDDPGFMLGENFFHLGHHPFAITVLPTRLKLECVHVKFWDGVVER